LCDRKKVIAYLGELMSFYFETFGVLPQNTD